MTDQQLYLAIGVPILVNALFFGLLQWGISAKFEAMNQRFGAKFEGIDAKFAGVDAKFAGVDKRFDAINQRFDDMRELWRSELLRVEGVLDARLKHMEEERH